MIIANNLREIVKKVDELEAFKDKVRMKYLLTIQRLAEEIVKKNEKSRYAESCLETRALIFAEVLLVDYKSDLAKALKALEVENKAQNVSD